MANQNPVVTFTMENGDVMKAELYSISVGNYNICRYYIKK
jgi:hypothetical protein